MQRRERMELVVLAGLVVVAAVGIAVAGLVVVRRYAPQTIERHNQVIGHVYSTLSILYGVLLAFVVVAVWQRYAEVREIVEREADALEDLYRDAQAYSPETTSRIRDRLRAYTRAVLYDEWRTMEHGLESPRAAAAYDAIWQEYHGIRPATEAQWLWHQRAIERLNELGDERSLRLLRSRLRQPGLLIGTMYVLGVVIVGFSYLFGVPRFGVHALLCGALAGTLALILILLWALDHPFGRLAPIQPVTFGQVLPGFGASGDPGKAGEHSSFMQKERPDPAQGAMVR